MIKPTQRLTAPPRGIRIYAAVLRSPGVLVPAVGTALASVPIGMLGLALLLLVQQRSGSFAAAGVVVAVLGVGNGVGMIMQGRLIDRLGPRRVLLASSTLHAVAAVVFVAVAGLRPPLWAMAALALVAGVSEPQVGSALRSLWSSMIGRGLRAAATALSSVLFELPVVAGPLLLTVVIAAFPVEVAVVVAAVLTLAGSWMFAWSGASGRWRRSACAREHGLLGPLAVPAVRVIVLVTSVQGLAIGLLQVTCAASATAAGIPNRAGVLYAVLTAGSLLGTMLYGLRSRPTASHWQVPALLAGLAASLAAAAAAASVALLAVCGLVFGLLVGPLTVRCFIDLERHAPFGSPASAVTVLIAAGLAATSAGSALGGWTINASGTTLPLLIGAGSSLLATLWLLLRTP